MENNEQLLTRLSIIEKEAAEIRTILSAPPKPTAEEWLKEFISQPFKVIHTDGYITYYLGDQWMFQKDLKNKLFWCYYYKVWERFYKEGLINYKAVQELYRNVVLKALDCEGFTPHNGNRNRGTRC